MVSSAANGFETVNGSNQATPFDFRPEYDTATTDHIVSAFARVGVMFAMEIGHNEQADNDSDDGTCSQGPVVPACYGQDTDYDGTSYIHDWPGLRKFTTATSVKIQSVEGGGIGPLSVSDHGRDYDGVYDRIQFETTANIGNPDCQGANSATCDVHAPFDGMAFYPFYALNELDIGHRKSVVTVSVGGKRNEEEVCSLLFGDFANSRETNNFGGDAQYGFPDVPRNRLQLVSDVQPNPCIPIIDQRHAKN